MKEEKENLKVLGYRLKNPDQQFKDNIEEKLKKQEAVCLPDWFLIILHNQTVLDEKLNHLLQNKNTKE